MKTSKDHNKKEQIADDLYNKKQTHKPKGLEIHLSKTTMGASGGYKNHDNFHNTIQQSPQSNPQDNESKEQYPATGRSNHLEATQESTKLSFTVHGSKDKDLECEIINNSNAKFYDENESKYLHVIDYDMQEPVSVIRNFDYPEDRHQWAKSTGNKTSDGFNEVYNDFNTTIQESDRKFLQGYNADGQLADQGNPRRLEAKQTNLHVNIPSNNVTITENEHVKFEGDLHNRKQLGNKVKNLIHDYELQVEEYTGHRKLRDKHLHQCGNILNTDTVQSPYTKCHDKGNLSSNFGETSLIEFSPSHKRELVSEKITNSSVTKANYACYGHSMTKVSNTSDISDSYPEKQSKIPRNNHLPSSPLDKTGPEDFKNISATKHSNSKYRHSMTKECNASDIPDSNSGKQQVILDNKHLKTLPTETTVSEREGLKNISATEVSNTGDTYSITKEGNTSPHSSYTKKQSLNARNRNNYTQKVGRDNPTVVSNNEQFSRPDIKEMRSDYQLQTCTGDSQVTRAHWYDIHGPLPQSSQELKPSILKEENTLTPTMTENALKSPPSTMSHNTVRGRNLNETRQKRWKSLGELDTIDKVEEYRLPDELNKTTAYPSNEHGMFDRNNNNLDTMYFNTISRNYAIQNANRVNIGYDHNDAKTPHRLSSLNDKNKVSNMHSSKNPEKVISSFDNNGIQTHKSPDAKKSPFLTRKKYVANTSDAQMFGINSTETLSTDYNTANQSPSLKKYAPTLYDSETTGKVSSGFGNKSDLTFSSGAKTSNQSPFQTRKSGKLAGTDHEVNDYSDSLLRISNDDLSSSLNDLETLDQSPMKRSRSPTKKREKLSGNIKNNNPSGSLLSHQFTRNHVNHLKGFNNNLSSSLTSLETLDQSPMKRSPKIKNLVNIEYYDINSDEELNSKIRRRPRTKSLNEENKTMESVTPTREFKSSGDLRSVGMNHEEINIDRKDKERLSGVDFSYVCPSRTHGKYTELYSDSIPYARHPQGEVSSYSQKVSPSVKVSLVDQYKRYSQGPQTAKYVTTIDRVLSNSNDHYSTEDQHGRSPLLSNRSVEQAAQNSNHVPSNNTSKLTHDLKQNESKIKRSLSPVHNSSKIDNTKKHHGKDIGSTTPKTTVKRLPNSLVYFSNSATKIDKSRKHDSTDNRDTARKSIVYPIKDPKACQGKYNIAKAEEEWRKKYGKLPYNNKDPLHQSSDKEFGRLFQHSEGGSKTQSSLKETGLTTNSSLLEGKINDTSSSSLFSPNRMENEDEKKTSKNSQAKEFSDTLNQLSSYVLSGYRTDQSATSPTTNQENTRSGITLKYKRYYLDDEGDLSYILDDLNESPKLSMLVHATIRLREVYSIQRYTKPETPEHPINLGNPQLRDAIQNKPMSVVKDLILANRSVDINIRSQSGDSALHRAAVEGDIDAIRIMINHGANVNLRDKYGFQPVHQALRCHHYKAAMFLMDCGTDLMSYTSKRIQEFVNVKAIAKQYLRQTLKTPL